MLAAFYFLCYLGAVLLIGPLLFAGTLVTKITQKSAVELALENLVIKLSCIPLYVYLLIDYFELFDSIILLNFGSLALSPAFCILVCGSAINIPGWLRLSDSFKGKKPVVMLFILLSFVFLFDILLTFKQLKLAKEHDPGQQLSAHEPTPVDDIGEKDPLNGMNTLP